MKKNDKIIISISSENKAKLRKTADELGLTLSSYCSLILLNAKPTIGETKD